MNRILFKFFVAFLLINVVNLQCADAQMNIYKVHSLFIYNFTKHIQWKEVGENFTIGVFGSTNAYKVLKENFAGKKFGGKEIKIITIEGIDDANNSQLVYMPKSNKGKILDIFDLARKNNVLFVSEEDFIDQGFPICFFLKGAKPGFKISRKNLADSGLKISTSLLSLAEVVN